MMNGVYTKADIKYWRPPCIRLTMLPNPELGEGKRVAIIDPAAILMAYPVKGAWMDVKGNKVGEEVEHTVVQTVIGHHLSVLETPEEVDNLRNRALGIVPEPPRSVK